MKELWILMLISLSIGLISKLIIGNFYQTMMKDSSKSPLTKQIKLKYENCKKLNICINNVNVFVEKSIENYRMCGLSLNGFDNISKEMSYICAVLGVINAIIYREDFPTVTFGLGIAALCILALKLLSQIIDTTNQKRTVILTLIDYLENTGQHREVMREEMAASEIHKFSKEASAEFNKLNKSFEKLEANSPKVPVDTHILEEILEEYLT